MKQIVKFGLIGTVGFIVDASILLIGVELLNFSIEMSRVFSFITAVFVTWFLNRSFTFIVNENISKKREYSLYLIIQIIGALINYFIFIFLVHLEEFLKEYLLIPLAIAAFVAMFFNYLVIKKLVFKAN